MTKKPLGSSVRDRRRGKSGKHTPDSEIDFSDIPELDEGQLKAAKKVGRPRIERPKQLIAIRIAPDLLSDLRKLAKERRVPYQTLMHELLQQAVSKVS